VGLDLLPEGRVYDGCVNVTLLYFDDCPNWKEVADLLDTVAAEFPDMNLTRRLVETDEEAQSFGFHGSPSIHVGGVDLFVSADGPVGLSCRMYETPDGLAGAPTLPQLRDALNAASGTPRK